ncbi:hypothetical protein [Streptomyces lavendulocolor]|uniref:hypothetical protein n=1 Tax=Streptomyces lavendulocolor TaxID=67316 RepID=UPI0031DC32ED
MTVNDALNVVVVATALRAFAPDVRTLVRRALSAGVRVGAADLMHDSSAAIRPTVLPRSMRDEEV